MVCRSHSISSSVCHDGHTLPDIRTRKWGTWTCSIILLNVSIVPVLISRCSDKDNVLQQQYCIAWLFIESLFYFCASVFLKKKVDMPCTVWTNSECNVLQFLYTSIFDWKRYKNDIISSTKPEKCYCWRIQSNAFPKISRRGVASPGLFKRFFKLLGTEGMNCFSILTSYMIPFAQLLGASFVLFFV